MRVNVHGTCIRVGRAGRTLGAPAHAGVLILGKSGAGKSDLALRLIALGATLVADDRSDLAVLRGRLVASAPRTIAGLLEVRGVGIVKMPHARHVAISLVVELTRKVARLPERETWAPPASLRPARRPALIKINPFEASAADKVLLAVREYS